MCSGNGAPGISTTFSGKRGMSDTRSLLSPPPFYLTVRSTGYHGCVEESTHTGRVALVTGGGRGIGAATARLLARQGAAVALAARTEEEIVSVAAEIEGRGGAALPLVVDVTDEASVAAGFERARSEYGPVTILVNNAGTPGVPLPVAALQPDSWRHVFEVNVTGAFLCAREALPQMVSENWGRIVNVSSAAARHPLAGMAAYGASKAALDQLTRVLALEGGPYNIVTTGVYPGVIDTRMQEESRGFGADLIGKQLHRMFQDYRDFGMLRPPEEPADLISYLCTPAASRLNGHILRLEQLAAPTDVTDPADCAALVARAVERFGSLEILVNNAGVGLHGSIPEGDPEDWKRMFEVNVLGVLYATRAAVRHMLQQGSGDVVFVSSLAGRRVPHPSGTVYAATKHAITAVAE